MQRRRPVIKPRCEDLSTTDEEYGKNNRSIMRKNRSKRIEASDMEKKRKRQMRFEMGNLTTHGGGSITPSRYHVARAMKDSAPREKEPPREKKKTNSRSKASCYGGRSCMACSGS